MPRYSALTRLRYAFLDLWACIHETCTPHQRPIAPVPIRRLDPRRLIVAGSIPGDPDLLWGYVIDDDGGGGGDGPPRLPDPRPTHGVAQGRPHVEKKAVHRLTDERAQHVTYRPSAEKEKVWVHRK